jgi:hypothetical protein
MNTPSGNPNSQVNSQKFRIRWYHVILLLMVPGTLGVAWFAWHVWPTAYRYDHTDSASYLVRIQRLTGKTEILREIDEGWTKLSGRTDIGSKIPESELPKLSGESRWGWDGAFEVSLYNGSEWDLDEITVRITTPQLASESGEPGKTEGRFDRFFHDPVFLGLSNEDKRQVLAHYSPGFAKLDSANQDRVVSAIVEGVFCSTQTVSRIYRLNGSVEAFAFSKFSAKLGWIPHPDQKWDWAIVGAKGHAR